MIATAIKTRPLLPPEDDLIAALTESSLEVKDGDIIAISSKVVSIGEGRCVDAETIEKDDLAQQEADFYLPRSYTPGEWRKHTIKNGILIGSAGIDSSNGNGYYILWPENPQKSADTLCKALQEAYSVKKIGVIITDSQSSPFRNGVTGITLACSGFLPLKDYRGSSDIFGKELQAERLNIADCLASTAVLVMGEGNESTPVVSLQDVPHVVFDTSPTDDPFMELVVERSIDLFSPFFDNAPWKEGGEAKA